MEVMSVIDILRMRDIITSTVIRIVGITTIIVIRIKDTIKDIIKGKDIIKDIVGEDNAKSKIRI